MPYITDDVSAENIIGLAEHKGEPLHRWRVGMVKCALGDDLLEELGLV